MHADSDVDEVVAHYTRLIQEALDAMDIDSIRQLVHEIEHETASAH